MAGKYSLLERSIARILGSMPGVKAGIKAVYRYINYWIFRKGAKFTVDGTLRKISVDGHESFFGYYDKSPVNADNTKIIFHSSGAAPRGLPDPGSPVDIVVYDTRTGEYAWAAASHAYNWQQGARLQWLDNERFIFNDFTEHDAYCARIFNANTMQLEHTVGAPVYDCHHDYALSLNFSTLDELRPDYGYRNLRNVRGRKPVDTAADGIFHIDLKCNEQRLIISIDDMIAMRNAPDSRAARHYCNHIMISPDGDKFIFLHRWFIGRRRYDRLIMSDCNGDARVCLSNDTMVSHCGWYGNDRIISYMRERRRGDGFYIIDTESGEIERLGKGLLEPFGDGHPSISGDEMIFDTYPNRGGMKELMLYDLRAGTLKKRGAFLEPLAYSGETRCDLHPRWAHDGKSVFIDSVHEGKRALYEIFLPEQ